MTEKEKDSLNSYIIKLENFEKEFINSSKRLLLAGNQKIFDLDLFAGAVSNRAISLIKGFVSLAKENNYLCAIPLIRMQLDNSLRFYASSLVTDTSSFFKHYSSGKAIRDYKSFEGKNLTDTYLTRKLETQFSGIIKLYKDTSGHIHLSDTHLFATTSVGKNKTDRKIKVRIGGYDIYSLDSKIDFISTMYEVSKIVIIVLEGWKIEKEKRSSAILSQNSKSK